MSEMHDLRRRLESHLERGGGLDASREASLAEQHARLATDVIEPEMTRLMDERDAARKHAASHVCGHTSPRPGDGALEAALEAADDHIQAQLDGRPETQCPGLRATDHAVLQAAIRQAVSTYLDWSAADPDQAALKQEVARLRAVNSELKNDAQLARDNQHFRTAAIIAAVICDTEHGNGEVDGSMPHFDLAGRILDEVGIDGHLQDREHQISDLVEQIASLQYERDAALTRARELAQEE
ncbi:hypothetical protein FHX37_0472 [Haloactinospora alba]|uniref:Uncharacterized protein n=1 Tax=Haloactinospora alba TaxID=405555 RepID=A0A543NFQ0_9ACTN|nr:hypothetical protein [Haloactinospora alba]TQN30590.1 hypothetical protein FHX37_0472 [Haloactinospora alba]